ncbi:5-formyltetrahydrofolate cyclo-ligase [Chishuiella changwenlii]|uniref:5-formyltetrahydrofolate cyclo-ligase n=1 Tax=Chishuiella changwenlii TaxID=1434701 RepID=A0A1M6Z9K2_9FLAO|nr:5-formyltetrahydrofolate cyclo-ligase [Chishuiella changwenlii]GGE86755.1 5-formyltetrahydrofolate cyclo-ligase [Chishuiella changwenlii]SHL27049.1 5-formyltetrahydrofolate cyclo-ligase [Chishuiella changwenlii]
MLKAEVRKYYRNIRKQFSKQDVERLSKEISDQLQFLDLSLDQTFHIFLPIEKNNEINTYPIIEWLFSQNKTVTLPLVVGDDMINCKVEKGFETQLNSLHIPEPIVYKEIESTAIDVIFIPMFVADKKGNRVGYGGGYYDKFLSRCRPDAKKIGLTYFRPIDSIDDVYFGDFPIDFCVTPGGIESFT